MLFCFIVYGLGPVYTITHFLERVIGLFEFAYAWFFISYTSEVKAKASWRRHRWMFSILTNSVQDAKLGIFELKFLVLSSRRAGLTSLNSDEADKPTETSSSKLPLIIWIYFFKFYSMTLHSLSLSIWYLISSSNHFKS